MTERSEAPTEDTLAATVAGSGTGAFGSASPTGSRGQLPRGATVGRYVVLGELGVGGMGVVYAAYDPELDRKVALKLLLAREEGTTGGTEGRTRLLREAQALAKLSHPSVVAIHDVGTVGERVWLAMEFVEGQTLAEWGRARRPSWREVLDVMERAGRGLAAAHAAGLLHRDFKPDNAMVGEDGRVRVMDFGLARTEAAVDRREEVVGDAATFAAGELGALSLQVTRAGALLGTPAYMAPEQLSGGEVSAAADQFAYCVTLWELLCGERPFAGKTLVELAAAVLAGQVRPVPKGRAMPGWLRRACLRGLAVDPVRRFASMDALLAELTRGRARARVRRVAAGVAAVALLGGAVEGHRRYDEHRRVVACAAEGASIEASWGDTTRSRLRDGLLATGAGYAATTAEKVIPYFDAQAQEWAAAATESCMDGTVRHTWNAALLDASRWCLEDRRLELEGLADELSSADAMALPRAVTAAAGLSRVDACRDARALAMQPPAPEASRAELREVRAQLARASALSASGRNGPGLEQARAALGRAEATGWTPLVAQARVRVGALLELSGDFDGAAQSHVDGYFEAASVGATEVAALAATHAVYTVGERKAQHQDGLLWGRLADVELARLGAESDDLRRVHLMNNVALVHRAMGAYAEARELNERALAIRERALGPEHPDVAQSLNNLAAIHNATGAHAEAKALLERALAIRERTLGADHPNVAENLNNLAIVHDTMGGHADAKALFERALAIKEKALGPDHPSVAGSLNNLAGAYKRLGAYPEARALYERALAIKERAVGPAHPDVAQCLANLAIVHQALGEYAEAEALHERALAIREQALGLDHPDVAASLSNLGVVHEVQGEYPEAKALYERALATFEQALGPEHPQLAYALTGLAEVALAQGRPADAVEPAERADRLRAAAGELPPDLRAQSRFVLARALWASGRDRDRARSLARQSADAYAAGGEVTADSRAEVDAWLAKHGEGG